MTEVHYQIVPHDGGWTYKVGDVFAETFAKRAAAEQRVPTQPTDIEFEDDKGRWHSEHSDGEAPATDVKS